MEKSEINGPLFSSSPIRNGGTFRSPASPPLQPNFSSRAVQEALEHLATIDLSELVNEAKIEHCRAARDLRSCGRYVQTPMVKSGNSRLRLRLFDECMDAGLISRRCDERFHEKEDRNNQLTSDVQRLYSFFDVALENNLKRTDVTDICMDETAVSSDAVTALLLDEKVVKDWVKWTFKNMATELQRIYYLEVEEMKIAQLHDLRNLQESILKTKQEIGCNCAAWPPPELLDLSADSTGQGASLFIEDALENLDIYEMGEESDFAFLKKNGALSLFQSKIGGIAGCYPFESLRAAVDILFLGGASDLVLAKQAIFVYFLFDRHWRRPEEEWRDIIDDFASSFGISRHSLLESFAFCLLDDHSHEALLTVMSLQLLKKECHQLLPEISGPETHPKIAQVLLERQNPKAAQMVIRGSGRDGGSQMVSLTEAVTIVRVKVECALLTEAFAYQRMICIKVREKKFKYELSGDAFDDFKGQCRSWMDWIEVLVTEFCCLCIRRNVVDQIIELPWNGEEEKYIHKCLLDCATDNPTSTIGSLLVVFYLQDKGIELLPEVLQQQVKTGTLPDILVTSHQEDETPTRTGFRELQEPKSASLLVPSTSESIVLQPDHMATPLRQPVSEIPKILGEYVNNAHVEAGTHVSTSILPGKLFVDAERLSNVEGSKNFKFENIFSPGIHRASPIFATPLKGIGQSSSRELSSRHLREKQPDKIISESEQNGFVKQVHNASPPYSRRLTANPASTPSSNFGLFKGLAHNLQPNISAKRGQSDRDDGHRNVLPTEDLMDGSGARERGLWRTEMHRKDQDGDPMKRAVDEGQSPDRTMQVGATPVRGRRRRFLRR
ncbi:2-oxoglutarate and Fe(II)-dependent oxygenase superfamily protein isoform 1 [Hibiscus syriacus]|uniref:2-oxoglutarate and Fe(II)-dependent oxygenase superfamily protein isoform 1 n=1 Tax=Hibiscus syriacus TaxID=106335 RepID=A0A6A2X9K5_HIBSY|nr:2-oxoglutarate and Fe(II)-dependent oxygenase superfamily protein isoform 1 [Hibiscus syriacus]